MLRRKYDSSRLSEFPLRPSPKQDRQEIFAENIFLKILCLERKRSERSGRRFLLMLVNSETLLQKNESEKILPQLRAALFDSKRETDIAGWYQEGATLGVIFTEMHGADRTALESLVRRLSGAMVARLDAKQVNQIRLSFHFFPEDRDPANTGRLIDKTLYPDLLQRVEEKKLFHFVKRSVDIAGSILALVIGFPLLVAISLTIKLTSKGPILFKQERIGWYGSRFTFLKFRSMKCGNDPSIHREYVRRFIAGKTDSSEPGAKPKAVYKIQDDARVTRVGRFLRRTSLDELPQFINVLKGEMSLVGPRPPIPYEVTAYRIWHRRRVLEAKPGITGLWQVNGRSRLRFDDMVRLDLRYAKTQSLWSDIRIILKTPRALLFCDGAY
jgi:lipopolysaccharide/colanic/teichoic acid biosynthesis glycosyltransferase